MMENWHVLLEETVGFGRNSYRWVLTKVALCADRDEARKRAYALAKDYQPQHPMSPRGRRVFQVGNDTWVVQVPGTTADYHFRVSAALLVAEFDKKGDLGSI
ncbi:hypothetical protein [Actinophytocola glycyrrhizae]|uniref:Uncharacterized protein n=1 Tax=Actinophytocola glycyrrhizae TaxID=2044873 RepID=A0ABV9SAB0_9PSEU